MVLPCSGHASDKPLAYHFSPPGRHTSHSGHLNQGPPGKSLRVVFPKPLRRNPLSLNEEKAPMIEQIAHDYWEEFLRQNPLSATMLGDRRFDSEMPDPSPEGRERMGKWLEATREKLAQLDLDSLDAEEQVTAKCLQWEIDSQLIHLRAGLDLWTIDPMAGIQTHLAMTAQLQDPSTPELGSKMAERWEKIGDYIDGHTDNLRHSLAQGKVAPKASVVKVISQVETMLATPTAQWDLLVPVGKNRNGWSKVDSEEFERRMTQAVENLARPAFVRYLDLLKNEILPAARGNAKAGLVHLPDGAQAYQTLLKAYTTLDLTAKEIHQIGLEELTRIREEMLGLGKRLLGETELPRIFEHLRSNPQLHFQTREEIQAQAEDALKRAAKIIPNWFGRLPAASCQVQPVPANEEKDSTIAYYRQPAADGSRPGIYYVNTCDPATRPRYEAEVLAFHESIPGHHLQIAIAQELRNLPSFRRHVGVTAYVEGWALYVERLAQEMGLYSGELSMLGVLSFDAWRACRLVIDTGLHALGWSRGQAMEFLADNTPLAKNNIENEIDRYLTWPGQAVSYKIGQQEMWRLRKTAERRLAADFDIQEFHDKILGNGAVSLPILAQLLEDWISDKLKRPGC